MFALSGYQILSPICETNHSEIYRGIRDVDNRPIILKKLKSDYPTSLAIARFQQEYDILKTFDNAGIIKVYELENYRGTLVLILEDFGGRSLKELINHNNLWQNNLERFLDLTIQIAEILRQVHTAKIIHRDINPANLLFNVETEEVKLIDFGISTRLDRTQVSSDNVKTLQGTLAYISPEQTGRMNRIVDYRTDFYSLGITLYEILTGQLPFYSNNTLEIIHYHLAKAPANFQSPYPEIITRIIMKLMAKNAEDRYQSAYGLKLDLERCLQEWQRSQTITPFTLGTRDINEELIIPQKLYGRERELEFLLAAFNDVVEGVISCQLMFVCGDSGIGKSALVRELYKPITKRRGYFIAGKFDQLQRNIPYFAIANAFRNLMRQILAEDDNILYQWRERLQTALGQNGSVIIELIPELESIVGEQPEIPKLDAIASQNRFNLVFGNFIRVLASSERPLVLFLDDLQWVDSASLTLIKIILTEISITGLLLIGAYRNNEVNALHPLQLALEELKNHDIAIEQIILSSLKLDTIISLLSDTLRKKHESVKTLAELILHKTNGNPFFINTFLKTLEQENLLKLQVNSSNIQPQWSWNIKTIEATEITNNVVDLMIKKIFKLPQTTRKLLQFSACIGNNFNLSILREVCQESSLDICSALISALQKGFIFSLDRDIDLLTNDRSHLDRLENINFKFVHDRIQQAAYTSIAENEKKMIHLQIGRFLRKSRKDRDEYLFDIVNQLNMSISLIDNELEKIELAQLNIKAGKKALKSTAYGVAKEYLDAGRSLLPENAWITYYSLTLSLYELSAEVAYLQGDFEKQHSFTEPVIQNARKVLDTVKVYELRTQSLNAQNRLLEAIDNAIEIIQKLGIKLSRNPKKIDILFGFIKTKLILLKIQDFERFPIVKDPFILAQMRVLLSPGSVAYVALPDLVPLLIFNLLKLSIKYGNSPQSVYGYSAYGFILCGGLGDIESGYKFGKLACQLLDSLGFSELKVGTNFIFYCFVQHWKEHLNQTLQPLLKCYQDGLETGDLEFAAWSLQTHAYYGYFVGKRLTEVQENMATGMEEIFHLKQEPILQIHQIYYQSILNLRDRQSKNINEIFFQGLCSLQGKIYNEQEMIAVHKRSNQKSQFFHLYFNKIILCYLFGEYDRAIENSDLAKEYLDSVIGLFVTPLFHFYDSLSRLSKILQHKKADRNRREQHRYTNKIKHNLNKLKKWSHHAPQNHLHKFYLVQAEYFQLRGRTEKAMNLYEQAIQGAKENGYLQEEALCYELAAKFYRIRGMETIAKTYIREARDRYLDWGAIAKVSHIEQSYSQYFTQPNPGILVTNTSTSSDLDLLSILRASAMLSSEIVLETLLTKLMRLTIENAGAEQGSLILSSTSEGDLKKWKIVASGKMNTDEFKVLPSIPLETADLPQTLITYVIRSQENLVLQDATLEQQFKHDPYIIQNQPKSVLCVPLLSRGKIIGVLYLENNLAPGIFTAEHVELLKLLSLQAAIALENAQLYTEVKDRENQLTQFLDAMPVGVAILDSLGHPYYGNSRAIELLGRGVSPEIDREEIPEFYRCYLAGSDRFYPLEKMPIVRALKGEKITIDNMEIHHSDRTIPIEAWGAPIYDQNGQIIYALVVFQDITQRKQVEKILADYNQTLENQIAKQTESLRQSKEAAETANRAKSAFLATMSHELRTPLNAILGFSEILSDAENLPNRQKEYLTIINRSGNHLLTLINDILSMSKIEAGQITLNQKDIDIYALLDSILEMFSLKAANKGIELKCDRDKNIPQFIVTDESKLRQILVNLLGNAIKFTERGSIVLRISHQSISSHQQSKTTNKIHFEIEDTGAGIAREECDRLFEPFVQTRTGHSSSEGTGLGLPISRKFVRLMGGDITVKSEIDKGSIFTFDICVGISDRNISLTKDKRTIKGLAIKDISYRILIVEDVAVNRKLLRKILHSKGFEVQEANNGQEAITLWKSWQPHLIFMDIQMPEMDGYEATRLIRAKEKEKTGKETIPLFHQTANSVPIVALTARAFTEDREAILAAGCDDFMSKPFRQEKLLEIIGKHLDIPYIYDESSISLELSEYDSQKNIELTSEHLSILPETWRDRLHQASLQCNDFLVNESIEQIPLEHSAIKIALQDLAENFRFDAIAELTRESLEKL